MSINHRKTVERCPSLCTKNVEIKQNKLDLIFDTQKSLLYCKDTPWKKQRNGEFVITVGANNGAETCEFVGLFLLYSIGENFNKDDISLYKYDGLTCFKSNNGNQNDKISKKWIKIFQTHSLKLEIKCN